MAPLFSKIKNLVGQKPPKPADRGAPKKLSFKQKVFDEEPVDDALDAKKKIPSAPIGSTSPKQCLRIPIPKKETTGDFHEVLDPEDERWLRHIQKRCSGMMLCEPVDRILFKQILQLDQHYLFADRVFDIFDEKNARYITVKDLLASIGTIARATPAEKLRFIFDIYDIDGSGDIEKHEFALVLQSVIDANSFALSHDKVALMTETLFEAIDRDRSGTVSFEELQAEIEKNPACLEHLQLSASKFLRAHDWEKHDLPDCMNNSQTEKKFRTFHEKVKKTCWPPYFLTKDYAYRHPRTFTWVIIYIVLQTAFYLYGSIDATLAKHRTVKQITNIECQPYYAFAHGFGMLLNLNVTILLILMLRNTLTYIRNSRIGWLFPLDHAIYAHKYVGQVVGVCVLGHFMFHMFHFRCLTNYGFGGYSYEEFLFSPKVKIGFIPGWVSITGWSLLLLHVIMFCCSLPFVRRSGMFEVFWTSHLLYIPYFVILLMHSDKFYMFFALPACIFCVEKLCTSKLVGKVRFGDIAVKEVYLWPNVTQLVISRPANFTFRTGDYIFLNIPAIAKFEWHPFTISSAPENTEYLTVHIRVQGQWTKQVQKYFKTADIHSGAVPASRLSLRAPHSVLPSSARKWQSFRPPNEPAAVGANRESDLLQGARNEKAFSGASTGMIRMDIPIFIDGPYGGPTTAIFDAEHAILVCGGIGVTPFASILQSIVNRYNAAKIQCPECRHQWADKWLDSFVNMRLRKVDFIWVVRDSQNIAWFVDILEAVERAQNEVDQFKRFVTVNIYVTSAKKMGDLTSFAFVTALDLVHRKTNRCLITGLRNPAIPGRPNWKMVFDDLKKANHGAKTMFYCGPRQMGQTLRTLCENYDFAFTKENF